MLKSFYYGAVIANLALIPTVAQAANPGSTAVVAATQGAAGAVDNFYRARSNAPMWFTAGRESAAAVELVNLLKRATLDGLASGPQIASQIERAIAAARSDPRSVPEAERMMSSALVVYVQALRAPTPGMIYGEPGMPTGAPQASIILRDAAQADSLTAYLASVSQVNPTYAALRQAALAGGGEVSPVIRANLDRARAIPAQGRFILVDAAAAKLFMYENGREVDSMKVIVGKPQYATPMIASRIHYATLNPYWHMPDHLVRDLVAANVLKQGLNYLKARGYEVVSEYSENAEVLSPASVDWKAVAAGTASAKIRQLPGANNSMGSVKFSFANGEGIYLHDTPDKALFAKDVRTLSNGCVRLEDAPKLARWLMGTEPSAVSSRPEQHVRLPKAVPIYITYLTANPNGEALTFVDDVYGRDRALGAKTAALN